MIYLFVGPDSAYLKLKVKQNCFKNKTALEKIEFINYSAYDDRVQDVVEEVLTPSFMIEKKIIIYDRCFFLSSSKERVTGSADNDLEALKELVNHPDPINDLYLLVVGSLGKGELIDLLKKKCKVEIVDRVSDADLSGIGAEFFKMRDIKIDQLALSELVKRVKGDYSLFMMELEKLQNAATIITLKEIDELVYKPLEDNIFLLATYLLQGKVGSALALYKDLQKGGNDPHYMLAILASQFKFFASIAFLVGRTMSEAEMAKELDVKPFRVTASRRLVGDKKPEIFHKILADLFDLDRHAKFDLDDPVRALELFIIEFKNHYLSH